MRLSSYMRSRMIEDLQSCWRMGSGVDRKLDIAHERGVLLGSSVEKKATVP